MAAVWAKTEAGRQEIRARSKVPSRLRRTLLLLVDGRRSETELLATVDGTSATDLQALAALGLIVSAAPAPPAVPETGYDSDELAMLSQSHAAAGGNEVASVDAGPMQARAPAVPVQPPALSPDFGRILTGLISRHLGLRGFSLTRAAERASSIDELRAVAERAIAAIGHRRGAAQGEAARRALYGGP